MSRHKEIDQIFDYIQKIDAKMEQLVERVAALVENACDMATRQFDLANAFNLLGEAEEDAVSGDLVECVAGCSAASHAYEVYARSLSEDVEEPLREYYRLTHSIRMAIYSRELAWTHLINCKAEVVSSRDKLSSTLMLSKFIGSEGREGLTESRKLAVEQALEEELRAQRNLDDVSNVLVQEFRRFLTEKQRDIRDTLLLLEGIEVVQLAHCNSFLIFAV